MLTVPPAVDAISPQGALVPLAIGIGLMVLLWGSASSAGAPPGEVDRVECRFNDASVPPQYHRSYGIAATRGQIRVVVDSYGDVLADRTFELTEEQWQELVTAIAALGIRSENEVEGDQRCVGGTSRTVKVFSREALLVDGTAYTCGGRVSGNLSGDVDAFFRLLQSMVPDFSKLLN